MGILSELFFDRKHSHYIGIFLSTEARPYISVLWGILFRTFEWNLEYLNSIGVSITSTQLQNIQKTVYNKLSKWVFSDPYGISSDMLYICENPQRIYPFTKNDLIVEYNFVFAVWLMNAIHSGKSSMAVGDIKGYGGDLANSLLGEGLLLTDYKFRNILQNLLNIYKTDEATYPERIPLYNKLLDRVTSYAVIREYDFTAPFKSASHRHLWDKPALKGYNIIGNLIMFHGIDPIDFRILDDNVFSSQYPLGLDKFTRHEVFGVSLSHLFESFSIPITKTRKGQILTTMGRNVGIYRTTPVSLQRLAVSLFSELMKFEKFDSSGQLIDLDYTDILRIYGPQNSWIYERWGDGSRFGNWYDDPDFLVVLNTFNHLRNEIRNKPIDKYLEDNWNTVYNEFWMNYMAKGEADFGLYYLIHKLEGLDASKVFPGILSVDYNIFLKNLIKNLGFPVF